MATLIIADQSLIRRDQLARYCQSGTAVHTCASFSGMIKLLTAYQADTVLIGRLPNGFTEVMQALGHVRSTYPKVNVVVLLDQGDSAELVIEAGATVCLGSNATIKEIAATLHPFMTPPQDCQDDCADLVGKSAAISELKAFIRQFAPMNSTVLIVGETGTGKEVVARLLHRLSARSRSRLVCVNCAAIPDTLLESDLFGHESGAFTGAHKRQPGQIRLAHGGTLFLDEIGDMSLVAQSKLLRVVETREIRPLGGSVSSTVDIRLITATHRRLEQMVADDQFRSDLFYRINVARIEIPPLRDRLEDVPLLARRFLAEFSSSSCKRIGDFTTGALQRLGNYDWPGNVRELKNVIEAAVVLCRSDVIGEEDLRNLPPNLQRIPVHRVASSVLPALPPGPEIDRLMEALRVTNWNYTKTARMLQWSRMTVYRKVAKYGMGRPAFDEYQTPELMGRVELANRARCGC